MNWVIDHLSIINSTMSAVMRKLDKLVEAASLPNNTPFGAAQWLRKFHTSISLTIKLDTCQNVCSNRKCFEWNPKVCPETRAVLHTWQIRFVSAPPPFLSSFPLYSEKCTTRERESSNCLLLRASEPLFPLPVSLQCDVKGWASPRIHPTLLP